MKALTTEDPVVIGEHRLRVQLGQGGMGRVYLGMSPAGREVAVKVLHPDLARDGDFLHRFEREVAAARAVSGIYTAPVVATGLADRPPDVAGFIAEHQMALETRLAESGAHGAESARTVGRTVAAPTLHELPTMAADRGEVRRGAAPRPPATVVAAVRLMYAGAAYALLFAICGWLIAVTHSGHPLVVWQGHWTVGSLRGLVLLYAVVRHTRDGTDRLGTGLFAVTWLIGAAALILLWQRRSSGWFDRIGRSGRGG